jgi:8-oxo-dGTP diphosphatase
MPVENQLDHTERYQLIPRTLIFLTCADHVLLIKGANDKKLWANLYNGIGGHIERGEGFLEAARRELFEESGLSVENLWLAGVITIDTGHVPGIVIFVLNGEIILTDETALPSVAGSEEGSLEWIPVERLQAMKVVEDLPVLLSVILSMKPGDNPFSARYSYSDRGELVIKFEDY